MMEERVFKVLEPRARATVAKRPRATRRSWGPILAELVKGREVFVPEDEVTDDGKYLRTALGRRGKNEHLRSIRDVQEIDGRGAVEGRRFWIEKG